MKNITSNKKELSPKQREELLAALKARFEKNLNRHKGLDWAKVQTKLEANPDKLWSLAAHAADFAKAEALLIDESLGRSVAIKLGIRTIGIVRILIEARDRELIPNVKVLLNRLESEANFWISSVVRIRVLQLGGE